MSTDSLGNPVTLQHAASLGALDDFVLGFISCEARAARLLDIADHDGAPLVQAYAACLHMFAEMGDAAGQARPFIDRALSAAPAATAREQRFIAAVDAWVRGNVPAAIALHTELARDFPRDLASLKLGQYHCFNRGDAPGMLRLALAAEPSAADVPYLHGMLAFGFEQCHLLAQAEASARRAIALCRKEPWAHHALAHVLLTQGRLREGIDFMDEVSDTWTGLNSFMVTHNWWHQALFLLELDRVDDVLALYDQRVWGVCKAYSQDQVNAISLLARLELAGADVADRWHDVAGHVAVRVSDQVLPFLDLQYLYGLARAQRPEAGLLLRAIEKRASTPSGDGATDAVWRQVGLPAARGLLAHAEGDMTTAATQLGAAMPGLLAIGGSHAQRDLFHQLHLDALLRSGRHAAAMDILQPQANAQPESLRLQRQARRLYEGVGLSDSLPPVSASATTS